VAPGTGARSGTLTIAGQTVTIDQTAGGISASFFMTDPGLSPGPTTECRITSGIATTCTLQSTSFPLGTTSLVTFTWTVSWTDGSVQSRTEVGTSPTYSFTWTCGGPNSTTDGAAQPLAVTLTVTDSSGGECDGDVGKRQSAAAVPSAVQVLTAGRTEETAEDAEIAKQICSAFSALSAVSSLSPRSLRTC
jgi:hypothetical protein